MPQGQRYSDARRARTPWARLGHRWRRWRLRARDERADGRDYTGWGARVVALPMPGARPGVGAEGVILGHQDEGARRRHFIELPGATWVLPLPSRCIELIPPAVVVRGPGRPS